MHQMCNLGVDEQLQDSDPAQHCDFHCNADAKPSGLCFVVFVCVVFYYNQLLLFKSQQHLQLCKAAHKNTTTHFGLNRESCAHTIYVLL